MALRNSSEDMTIMHAFVTLRNISGARRQAVPVFVCISAWTFVRQSGYASKGSTIVSTWSSCSARQTVQAISQP